MDDERHADQDNPSPELAGRHWTVEGMSYLIFDGLSIFRAADYRNTGQ